MSDTPLAIGIDFGGTTVKIGVLYRSNIIDSAPPIGTQDFDGPDALIEAMVRVINELRERHPGIAAIGVGEENVRFLGYPDGHLAALTTTPLEVERLAADAALAPSISDEAALAFMATAEIRHFTRLVERLSDLGVDPWEAMAPFQEPLAEFHAQTAVECAMKLHPLVKDRLDAIERVELTTHESAIRIIDKSGPLNNPADRDHCLQYMTAIGMIFGRCSIAAPATSGEMIPPICWSARPSPTTVFEPDTRCR